VAAQAGGRRRNCVSQEGTGAVDERTHEVVLSVLARHARSDGRPTEFELLGLTWDLMEGVFAPVFTSSTELYSIWMPYPVGGAFLEVGCGAGVTAVLAALRGCSSVTALDISPAAVANARSNAERHGVTDRLRVLQSNMFAGLVADARFDVIFWNSSYAEAPADFVYETELHHAFFDAGYRSHRAYLEGARRHLNDGGRLLLGFGDVGNRQLLDGFAEQAGLVVRMLGHASETATTMDCQLLELVALR
jgi:release factor glutamine methyltransferase